jgi:predicted RNase H-like HicB family nuclease
MRYVAFIHGDTVTGYGISFPDFPGCVSSAETIEGVIRSGEAALSFHIEGMKADGLILPRPSSMVEVRCDAALSEWREGAILVEVFVFKDQGAVGQED